MVGHMAVATIAGGALLAAPALAPAQDGEAATSTFHHRALWIENPSSETVLSWTTSEEGSNHRVYWDTEARNGDITQYANETATFSDGKVTMKDDDWEWVEPAYYHHVHLDGLEADTNYYVVFASDDAVSDEFHFRTAPDEDVEVSILFGGDSRIRGMEPYNHTERQQMNLRIRHLFENYENIIAFAHGGDYCMLADWRYMEPWLTDHEMTTTRDGRLLPVIPARGNHDRGIGFEEAFAWPELDRNYYFETKLTPAVSLITLNTETELGGEQRDWLAGTLAAIAPERRWLAAQYHRPAFPSVRSAADGIPRRTHWVPLFEEYGVALGMESHDHSLKRTVPIRSYAPDFERGVVYIGDGGLGAPLRNPDPDRWWLQEPGMVGSVYHVHVLTFGEEELHGRAYGMGGDVVDDFTIEARE